ncbi:TPA: hypothetical protein JAD17_002586 [Proteus mirabilis]|nr:hypothetical protein [Proteus mirabilis]HAT5548652.1 hypothetical protein [Proteus mirabilis]
MLKLGLAALAHANWHANYYSFTGYMWSELSVLQAAHAAEILIKARITQEHPLLIFEQLPRSNQTNEEFLSYNQLIEKGKTIQYFDLPERLWASTGIRISNLELYQRFGKLRNSIQHFANPIEYNCCGEARNFIYEVIDPFINECWGLCAIDFNEDTEPYIYLIETLFANQTKFLVSEQAAISCDGHIFDNPDNSSYKKIMLERFKLAGGTILFNEK